MLKHILPPLKTIVSSRKEGKIQSLRKTVRVIDRALFLTGSVPEDKQKKIFDRVIPQSSDPTQVHEEREKTPKIVAPIFTDSCSVDFSDEMIPPPPEIAKLSKGSIDAQDNQNKSVARVPPPPPLPRLVPAPKNSFNSKHEQNQSRQISKFTNQHRSFQRIPPPPPQPPKNVPISPSRRKDFPSLVNETYVHFLPKGMVCWMKSQKPKTLIFAIEEKSKGSEESIGESLLNTFNAGAKIQKEKEEISIYSIEERTDLSRWRAPSSTEKVILALNNEGEKIDIHLFLKSLISFFSSKDLNVYVALPRAEQAGETRTFQSLSFSHRGRTVTGAVHVEASDIHVLPLQRTLEKITERKEREITGGKARESLESRIAGAYKIFASSTFIQKDDIAAVNLWLRGLTKENFRSLRKKMLTPGDWKDEEKERVYASKDVSIPLSDALLTNQSMLREVLFYKEKHFRVVDEKRFGHGKDAYIELKIKNPERELLLTYLYGEIAVDGSPLEKDERVLWCSFKRDARIEAFYNDKGEFSGIERVFFGSNAEKPQVIGKSKRGKGDPSAALSIIYGEKKPEVKIIGEGRETVGSMLKFAYRSPKLQEQWGITLRNKERRVCNCQFSRVLGVNDLIKAPIESSVKTIILVVDIDGFNLDTKMTIINTAHHFLDKGYILKIAYTPSHKVGKRADINDGLNYEKSTVYTVSINQKEEFLFSLEPLEQTLEFLRLKEKIKTQPHHVSSCLHLGKIFIHRKEYTNALEILNEGSKYAFDGKKESLLKLIGDVQLEMKVPDLAFKSYSEAFQSKLSRKIDISYDLDSLNLLQGIGSTYLQKGNFEAAYSNFVQVYEEKKKLLNDNDGEELASTCFQLAKAETSRGNFGAAKYFYQEASRYFTKGFKSKKHPFTAQCLEEIGDVCQLEGKFTESISRYREAQKLLDKIYCIDTHGQNKVLSQKIGDAFFAQNQFLSSLPYYKESLTPAKGNLNEVLKRGGALSTKSMKTPFIGSSYELPPIPNFRTSISTILAMEMLNKRAKKKRTVVLDTEFSKEGKIIEIGWVELHGSKMGQFTINPNVLVEEEILKLTGISQDSLASSPPFSQITVKFLEIIDGADLVFHDARKDLEFLSKELNDAGVYYNLISKHGIIDTYPIAKRLFPNQLCGLDELSKRLDIIHPGPRHRALGDAELTKELYLQMLENFVH